MGLLGSIFRLFVSCIYGDQSKRPTGTETRDAYPSSVITKQLQPCLPPRPLRLPKPSQPYVPQQRVEQRQERYTPQLARERVGQGKPLPSIPPQSVDRPKFPESQQHVRQQRQQSPDQQKPSPPSIPVGGPPIHFTPQIPDPHEILIPSPLVVDESEQNEHYEPLRSRANEEGDKMGQCFQRSREAYQSGNGALAKELSDQGKAHQKEMARLHWEAGEWIFNENNKHRIPGEVDLHGLYVKEAVMYVDRTIKEARQRGDRRVHFIVGKGLHSADGTAKLKPAIEEYVQKQQLVAETDPRNYGVLVVILDDSSASGDSQQVMEIEPLEPIVLTGARRTRHTLAPAKSAKARSGSGRGGSRIRALHPARAQNSTKAQINTWNETMHGGVKTGGHRVKRRKGGSSKPSLNKATVSVY